MDSSQFDALVRRLVGASSRRGVTRVGIGALATAALAAYGLGAVPNVAAKKKGGKGKGSNGKKGKGKKGKGKKNSCVAPRHFCRNLGRKGQCCNPGQSCEGTNGGCGCSASCEAPGSGCTCVTAGEYGNEPTCYQDILDFDCDALTPCTDSTQCGGTGRCVTCGGGKVCHPYCATP